MAKNAMTLDIQNELSSLEFPANKQALIAQAKHKSASHEVIASLNGLPDREYMDIADLSRELES